MANAAHLAILKSGVEAWEKWRQQNPNEKPDLSGADLLGANLRKAQLNVTRLSGADLRLADLTGANLRDADLGNAEMLSANLSSTNLNRAHFVEAKLPRADLSDADLSDARLGNADLAFANLSGTDLQRADLRGAFLLGTSLWRAKLGGANFSKCDLAEADLGSIDLSEVIGLETVHHHGPSTVGIDTLYKSGGRIPVSFLRGCGVPDALIEFSASLIGKPLDFYSCFISYSSHDEGFAKRLHADLQAKGVRCWFAPEDLKIGDKFRTKIDETIRVYDKLLLVLSEHSVHSDWVEKEVETALEREREQKRTMLFSIRLDDAVMEIKTGWPADISRTRHIGDFTNWKNNAAYQKALARLLHDLKAEAPQVKSAS